MYIREWKIRVRLAKDGNHRISTYVIATTGDHFADTDVLTGPEKISDIVQNHLSSAEKVFQARVQSGLSK